MYDLIIIGGGPAGLSAGIYAVRFGLQTLVLERNEISGQISMSDMVENYPGLPSISGIELMEKYRIHAREVGVETRIAEVLSVRTEGTRKIVSTDSGDLEAKALIIATGANPKPLNVPGEKEFISNGVSYCAICDGPFFKNKTVVVLGGGNSAVTDALLLSKIAQKVYLVHRRDRLRAAKVLQDRASAAPNIELILNNTVLEIAGSREGVKRVEKIILQDVKSKEIRELSVSGVFIYVGIHPNTELINVEKNSEGFIKTDRWMETSEKGIFAAGDCSDTPIWQLVAAVRDGAVAATAANEYIEKLK
jgi:thioredoxin reductase (NADPH)